MSSVLRDGAATFIPDPVRAALPDRHLLDRPRLTEALAADVPLALVVAPAGSGKTVAVQAWAARVRGPLAWASLQDTDLADVAGAWDVVVAALRGADVRVPSLVSLGDRAVGDRAFTTMLAAHVAAHPEHVALVLDCAGPVPAGLARGLERVLRDSAGRLRLVLLSRTDPPLPLTRHRLDGSVVELREADLAFRPAELTALLAGLSPADRRLLLDCSAVDDVVPGLVEVLGGPGAGRRLGNLGRAFAEEAPARRGTFRVRPQVREALYAQLEAGRARDLHRQAASWLAGGDQWEEATRQAALGGAWQEATRYALEAGIVADLLLDLRRVELVSLFGSMPVGEPGPGPALVRGVLAARRGDLATASAQVALARAAAPSAPSSVPVDLLELAVASATGDAPRVVALVERIRSEVDEPGLLADVEARRADALLMMGRLHEAGEVYRRSGRRPGRLALVEALRGELRSARVVAGRAPADDPCAVLAVAWADVESDEVEAARARLAGLGPVAVTSQDPVPGWLVAVLEARLRRFDGDLDGARAALTTVPADGPAWLADLQLLEHAALDLAARRPAQALTRHAALADPTSPRAELLLWQVRLAEWTDGAHATPPRASVADRVEAWLVEASRRLSLGETAAARRAVQRALSLAAPEQLRRPFREASPDVRRLLAEHPSVRGREPSLPGAEGVGAVVVMPLTEKEREVLGHLAAMLSTDEIAAEMFVSVNTVRTHVRNILRKLGASRRNEAVRRARTLHLIPT